MTRTLVLLSRMAASLAITGCGMGGPAHLSPHGDEGGRQNAPNPLFSKSPLQYEAPDYAAIKRSHFRPAFERGMKEQAAEVEAIAASVEPPTFENTILAMETSGAIFKRASDVFESLTETVSDDEIRALQTELAPKTVAHWDAIYQNERLFARVEKIYERRADLDREGRRLVEKYMEWFVRAGAKLDSDAKARLREINAELSKLTTAFSQNLLKATQDNAVLVEDRAELAGLSDSDIAGMAAAAGKAGHEGQFGDRQLKLRFRQCPITQDSVKQRASRGGRASSRYQRYRRPSRAEDRAVHRAS